MRLDWKAVAYGFSTAFVLGLVVAYLLPLAGMMMPVLTYGLIGGAAGLVAGYYTTGGMGSAALNGGLSTTLGGVLVLAALVLLGLLFEGLVASFGIAVAGLLLLATYAIPGAVGGALGEWFNTRRKGRRAETTAR